MMRRTEPGPVSEKAAVQRWIRGQREAARRSLQAAAEEGPKPEQAVAEAMSAARVAEVMGLWPGPRDPTSEAAVLEVRARWARIQKAAKRERRER